jgi:hypothetical protein
VRAGVRPEEAFDREDDDDARPFGADRARERLAVVRRFVVTTVESRLLAYAPNLGDAPAGLVPETPGLPLSNRTYVR